MRYDFFMSKKSVHVKLSKEVHEALRVRLFRHGLTMQDLFNDVAELAVSGSPKAENLFEKISRKKLTAEIEKLDKKKAFSLGELDSETMYSLLEGYNKDEDE